MAAREMRRAKGRSALVLATIALPVLALSFTAVTYDTFRLTPAESLDRRLGSADAELNWVGHEPVQQDSSDLDGAGGTPGSHPEEANPPTAEEILASLPPGSRLVPAGTTSWLEVWGANGKIGVEHWELDLGDPLHQHLASLVTGRVPTAPAEAALSERALRQLGVAVGGTIRPIGAIHHLTVVGVVEVPANLGEVLVVPPAADPYRSTTAWLVDVPGDLTSDLVGRLRDNGIFVTARPTPDAPSGYDGEQFAGALPGNDPEALSFGVLIGGLGLLEVVLLAGPALAVGARRRQRDLALIAANGGTSAQLRRIVLADGVVLGGCGALVGLVLGATAAVAGRPLVEEFLFQQRGGALRFFPAALFAIAGLAVVTGVLAALVPAYSAARQDVVAALSGRRGRPAPRRRWLMTGVALTVFGTALTAAGAGATRTNVILSGLILAEIGLVLCTPSVVGLLARVGRLLPLAPRIALRDTARNRASAAPAISAVMAAVAGSVALGVYETGTEARRQASMEPTVPPSYVSVSYQEPPRPGPPLSEDQVASIAERHFAVTGVVELRQAACPGDPDGAAGAAGSGLVEQCAVFIHTPPERECPYYHPANLSEAEQLRARADPRCQSWDRTYVGPALVGVVLVDDGPGLSTLTDADADDLAAATEVLRDGGVVVNDPLLVVDGMVTVEIVRWSTSGTGRTTTQRLPGAVLSGGFDSPRQIISAAALARLGLATESIGFLVATSGQPDDGQRTAFQEDLRAPAPQAIVDIGDGRRAGTDPMLLLLAGAAGLITIGVAGMATGLAAAEGRADLSTLAAMGASPTVRRTLSLSQAGVIAGLGSLLGVVAGLTAAFAILAALNRANDRIWPVEAPYPLLIPWQLVAVLFAVPLVAMLGAGLLTPSRLPVERRIV